MGQRLPGTATRRLDSTAATRLRVENKVSEIRRELTASGIMRRIHYAVWALAAIGVASLVYFAVAA